MICHCGASAVAALRVFDVDDLWLVHVQRDEECPDGEWTLADCPFRRYFCHWWDTRHGWAIVEAARRGERAMLPSSSENDEWVPVTADEAETLLDQWQQQEAVENARRQQSREQTASLLAGTSYEAILQEAAVQKELVRPAIEDYLARVAKDPRAFFQ